MITDEEIGYLKDAQQFHGWSDRAFSYVVKLQTLNGCHYLTRKQYAYMLIAILPNFHYRDYIEQKTAPKAIEENAKLIGQQWSN